MAKAGVKVDEIVSDTFGRNAELAADWDDANRVCDRYGAPKGMSLTGRVTWLMTKTKPSATMDRLRVLR